MDLGQSFCCLDSVLVILLKDMFLLAEVLDRARSLYYPVKSSCSLCRVYSCLKVFLVFLWVAVVEGFVKLWVLQASSMGF